MHGMAPKRSKAPLWVLREDGDRVGSGGEDKPHSQFCHSLCLGYPWGVGAEAPV